jgi:hypothetical protein
MSTEEKHEHFDDDDTKNERCPYCGYSLWKKASRGGGHASVCRRRSKEERTAYAKKEIRRRAQREEQRITSLAADALLSLGVL